MTKLLRLPFFLLLLLFSFSGIAQYSVEGKVVDINQNPVAYANIILLNAKDSTTVYRGAVSAENGVYQFRDVEKNEYLLKVSFVGFEDALKRIKVSGDLQVAPLILQENSSTLDEVSINYKNPSVDRQVDRLVFKVENTTLSSGNSWDILKKTPGVIVANNSLQVRNQGVQVYINDRKVQLSASELKTLLENYSAENIKSVEVITTPPARYDAEGGAILNITTTKSIAPGYKGNINGAYTQAIYPKYNLGTSHYHKTENLNLFANYSFNARKEYKEDESYINYFGVPDAARWETDFNRTTRSKAHNANLILDYNLDERNQINFSSSATLSPNKTFRNNGLTKVLQNSTVSNRIITESDLEEDLSNIAADLEYKHSFKKPGAQFSVKGHYTHYEQDRLQTVETREVFEGEAQLERAFFTDSDQKINIYTTQVDFVSPLGGTNFEAGVKASVIESESGMFFYDLDQARRATYNANYSDTFLYDENIYAAYFSLAKDWEKWSLKGGLRGEFTDRTGDSRSMDQVDQREYFDVFPTVYLQRRFSDKHSLTFDYSRRIQRPRYESLNPFRYFLSEYDYNSGNPNLKSAISDNFTLSYAFKNEYFFDLYYRDNGGYPQTLSFQDYDTRVIRRVSVNLEESISYGLDISHGRSLANWWYAYAYASFFHEEQTFLALESGNVPVTNEIDAFYGTWYNSLIISKDGTFTGEMSFTYVSDWITGSYNFDPMTTLSLGLRKTFWNNRAELSVNVDDILDKTNTWLTSRYLNQDNAFYAQPESRFVRVGFKYNFGNFRLSDNQRAIEAAERDRL